MEKKDTLSRLKAEERKLRQQIIIDAAREVFGQKTYDKASMAEIATDVLHNVGNVLNSINVATGIISESISKSEVSNLQRIAEIIKEHNEDLGEFLTKDQKGKHIPISKPNPRKARNMLRKILFFIS